MSKKYWYVIETYLMRPGVFDEIDTPDASTIHFGDIESVKALLSKAEWIGEATEGLYRLLALGEDGMRDQDLEGELLKLAREILNSRREPLPGLSKQESIAPVAPAESDESEFGRLLREGLAARDRA